LEKGAGPGVVTTCCQRSPRRTYEALRLMARPSLAAALLLSLVAPALSFYEHGSDVHDMKSKKQWGRVERSNHLWIVEFYREG